MEFTCELLALLLLCLAFRLSRLPGANVLAYFIIVSEKGGNVQYHRHRRDVRTGPKILKLFCPSFMNVRYKLEYLAP